MVVVAIIGVLASLAAVTTNNDPKIEETANLLALRISDAAREAKSAGPVVDTVAAAEGDSFRTRLFIADDGDGQYFSVDLRVEDTATTSSYLEVGRSYVRRDTIVAGVEEGFARTETGGTVTTLPSNYELLCSPGTGCGPVTFYLKTTDSAATKYRVVVMPLSTLPLVLADW